MSREERRDDRGGGGEWMGERQLLLNPFFFLFLFVPLMSVFRKCPEVLGKSGKDIQRWDDIIYTFYQGGQLNVRIVVVGEPMQLLHVV